MNRSVCALLLTVLATAACAHLPAAEEVSPDPRPAKRLELAREALHGGQFATADQLLTTLAAEDPTSADGHEAQFLLGLLHLDPRNPAWSPAEAANVLGRYLEFPFGELRPEAVALYALARHLATPLPRRNPAEGAGGSAAGAVPGEAGESERLRRELAARDQELAKLRDELERIRRTLAPPG